MGISFDDADKCYMVSVWGDAYRIYPHRFKIECTGKNHQRLHSYFDLFTVHYLLNAKEIEIENPLR